MKRADPDDPKLRSVVAAGLRAGIEVRPVIFEEETRTSAAAAAAIGCEVAEIAKSLIFEAVWHPGESDPAGGPEARKPVLLLLSGADRVDLARAAAAIGVARLRRMDAEKAKITTGFSIGATPPFGHPQPIEVYMDDGLMAFTQVWAAGGRTDAVFPIAPTDLHRASGASLCRLREEDPPA